MEKELEEAKKEIERLRKVEKEFDEFKALHSHTVGELRKALNIKADKVKTGLPLGAPKGHNVFLVFSFYTKCLNYFSTVNDTYHVFTGFLCVFIVLFSASF